MLEWQTDLALLIGVAAAIIVTWAIKFLNERLDDAHTLAVSRERESKRTKMARSPRTDR